MIEITLPGRPIPWARARKGKRGFFTPLKQAAHRKAMALIIKAKRLEPLTGPVAIDVTFDYGTNETRILVYPAHGACPLDNAPRYNGRWKATRADLDNLVKQINEGLQDSGLLADDAQVAVLWARKVQ